MYNEQHTSRFSEKSSNLPFRPHLAEMSKKKTIKRAQKMEARLEAQRAQKRAKT
jgi:hypothetical protein